MILNGFIIQAQITYLPGISKDHIINRKGWGNGYVIIPKDHIFFEKNTHYINQYVSVHGGLTYDGYDTDWVDFKIDSGYEPEGNWVVGFDTNHVWDNEKDHDKEYVINEVTNLIAQLNKYLLTTDNLEL